MQSERLLFQVLNCGALQLLRWHTRIHQQSVAVAIRRVISTKIALNVPVRTRLSPGREVAVKRALVMACPHEQPFDRIRNGLLQYAASVNIRTCE